MTRVLRLFEALLLILFGGLMVQLVDSGNLWLFLNPKFDIAIAAAGSILLLLGIMLPFDALVRPALFRTAVWTLFLLIAMIAVRNADDPFSGDVPYESAFGSPEIDSPDPFEYLDGQKYLRADLFELYLKAAETPDKVGYAATKGMVVRTPEMDAQNKFGMVRIVITCCLADAVAVGFTVSGPPPESLKTGQWVEVLGKIEQEDVPPSSLGKAGIQGVVVTSYSEKAAILADEVRAIPPPDMPYIF